MLIPLRYLTFLLLFVGNAAYAGGLLFGNDEPPLLSAEDAFQIETGVVNGNQLIARFTVADGYYLYRHQFKVTSDNPDVVIGELRIPDGLRKHDEAFGEVEAYYQHVEIVAPILKAPATPISITVRNQGCADIGLCYPPMKHTAEYQISFDQTSTSEQPPVNQSTEETDTNRLARLLEDSPLLGLLLFFVFGVGLSFNPCSYPMYPILSRIIVGQGTSITRWRGISLSLAYIIPMALTYAAAGAAVALAGQNLFAAFQSPLLLGAVSILLVGLALSMFGLYEIQLPAKWQTKLDNVSQQQASGSYIGAAIMGALSALIVGACVLPPLTAALLFISESGNVWLGTSAMLAFGLGMGVPLLIIGASAGWLLPKAGSWMERIKSIFGLILLAGVILIIERVISAQTTMLLWGLLALISTIVFWISKTTVLRVLAVLFAVWGGAIFYGASQGITTPLTPLSAVKHESIAFNQVKTIDDVNAALANNRGQISMLDFYADWCIPCRVMEEKVFTDPEVKQALSRFKLLQADVTENDEVDIHLKSELAVLNPPTIVFFDQSGNEIIQARITGKVDSAKLLKVISTIP
jgi:thiol:disulfide interchange protein DsbD